MLFLECVKAVMRPRTTSGGVHSQAVCFAASPAMNCGADRGAFSTPAVLLFSQTSATATGCLLGSCLLTGGAARLMQAGSAAGAA